jgi:hypothetical protein
MPEARTSCVWRKDIKSGLIKTRIFFSKMGLQLRYPDTGPKQLQTANKTVLLSHSHKIQFHYFRATRRPQTLSNSIPEALSLKYSCVSRRSVASTSIRKHKKQSEKLISVTCCFEGFRYRHRRLFPSSVSISTLTKSIAYLSVYTTCILQDSFSLAT